jgi:glycosyltransferase involved in cell wall biosynthesis
MKAFLKRLSGADRPRVFAVIGITLEDVGAGIAHARTSGISLPVWAWSAETAAGSVAAPPDCDRLVFGATAAQVRKDLRSVWPVLIIVAWTGERRSLALKLLPFTVPPFRIVISNEARGYFAARPGPLAAHARRRLRDAAVSAGRRASDWTQGLLDWWWSVLLAAFGVLAKITPPLTRAALRRMPEGHPAPVAVPLAGGSRFTEIEISGRAWPRRRILDAALDSSADFIVFRRTGETAAVAPLIALARETNSFAAGPQMAYTGWRKIIVNRHPFRKLQPEEVTEVRAPWSPLLVVRRDLLLRFGVPRACTFGGALLVLYRQAAAAGLKNMVTASGASLTQEPAMELEDAELALRLAFSPSLRRLAPAHPSRGRGNLTCAPARRRNFRNGLPRVLVVSPYLPFPLSHGGAVRMYNLCRALSGEVDFVLACFREANETVRYEELHRVFRQVHVLDNDEKHADPSVPAQVSEYRNSAMAALIRHLCLSGELDLVQIEYTQMAEYRAHTGPVPVLLVEHDLTFTLHEQLAKTLGTPAARRQYELWLAFERSALQGSNAVWTMSGRDREIAWQHGAPRSGTAVVPNGVDLQRFQPVRRQTQERTVLFVGSFRHLPNLLAFEALRVTIMPLVWKVFPDVKLNVIAGPHFEAAADAAKKRGLLAPDPRIRIQGFVEDVRPAYRECDIAAIPLPVSAGTNIKLMEAMACGRAVVSTALGCQGLGLQNESDLLIREVGPAFAEAIVHLLRHEAVRLGIASKGRKTAEARFGWNAIAAEAAATYAALMGQAGMGQTGMGQTGMEQNGMAQTEDAALAAD